MTAHDLTQWAAFERVYGPILVHERVDIGLARLAQMWGRRGAPLRDFMPHWYRDLTAEDSVKRGFAALLEMAEEPDADH